MKEAMFYKKKGKILICGLCPRKCSIAEGKLGFCGVRKNVGGKLQTLVYGRIVSIGVDPIEKKPLYMFAPGSKALSMSTVGCNFRCKFCCNYQISQSKEILGDKYEPRDIVAIAKTSGVQGLAYTYVEPTVFFEFSYDTARLARKAGFYNTWVTNGYTSPEAIKKMSRYLDAVVVDFKGSGNSRFYRDMCGAGDVEPIYQSLLEYKKNKVYFEVTNLIVPGKGSEMNELRKMCRWIAGNLGYMTPIHLLRFYPTYGLENLQATPTEMLEKAYAIAKEEGLMYVYVGNVPNHEKENTFCHNCGQLLIERSIGGIRKMRITGQTCPKCGVKVPIFGLKWVMGKNLNLDNAK